MLLSTSAIRELKRRRPDIEIVYQTFLHNRTRSYAIEYPNGTPAELLMHNPDISEVIDVNQHRVGASKTVDFHYAKFGGAPLDYPIQAHYWENLDLDWSDGQRFDAFYYPQGDELEWARSTLRSHFGDRRTVAIGPHSGWKGKQWLRESWNDLIAWCFENEVGVVMLAGHSLKREMQLGHGLLDLSGQLNMRQTAAMLDQADAAVLLEGGLSNIRFALGKEVILLTCATRTGLQIWTPPELTIEIRMIEQPELGVMPFVDIHPVPRAPIPSACDPCLWRGRHVQSRHPGIPPAHTAQCPKGRSLRDVPASVVIAALDRFLRKG